MRLSEMLTESLWRAASQNMSNLKILHLSHNNITRLRVESFRGLGELKSLYLKDRNVLTVPLNSDDNGEIFLHLKKLKNLSLSDNKLTCLPTNIFRVLSNLRSLNLSYNFLTDLDLYMSHMRNLSMISLQNNLLENINKDVKIFFTDLIYLFILYRWNLRYMYYSAKTRWNRNGYTQIAEADVEVPEFEFDVFVSYAAKDGAFVKESVFAELEEKRNMKMLIHDRDFRAGEFVNDNIMHAIITSRKTLIILSKAFLQSHWCRFEMHMARLGPIKTGRNVLCVLMKDHVPTKGLPLEIIDIIRNRTYPEMPDEIVHCADVFWDRLRDALMH
ncbi:toll-like receptor 4 [Mercenaria mercenaria]|uniref:toll-like receptor 4 n=1 Tax=Mercenaria mercenaria TaxID=6596 RepID=UPI00234E4A37|nr:toll-like receptor 4 [Mercenaria mercenaria]